MAEVEAKVEKLCRGMLIMAQQADTARAAAAAKLVRYITSDSIHGASACLCAVCHFVSFLACCRSLYYCVFFEPMSLCAL